MTLLILTCPLILTHSNAARPGPSNRGSNSQKGANKGSVQGSMRGESDEESSEEERSRGSGGDDR